MKPLRARDFVERSLVHLIRLFEEMALSNWDCPGPAAGIPPGDTYARSGAARVGELLR